MKKLSPQLIRSQKFYLRDNISTFVFRRHIFDVILRIYLRFHKNINVCKLVIAVVYRSTGFFWSQKPRNRLLKSDITVSVTIYVKFSISPVLDTLSQISSTKTVSTNVKSFLGE